MRLPASAAGMPMAKPKPTWASAARNTKPSTFRRRRQAPCVSDLVGSLRDAISCYAVQPDAGQDQRKRAEEFCEPRDEAFLIKVASHLLVKAYHVENGEIRIGIGKCLRTADSIFSGLPATCSSMAPTSHERTLRAGFGVTAERMWHMQGRACPDIWRPRQCRRFRNRRCDSHPSFRSAADRILVRKESARERSLMTATFRPPGLSRSSMTRLAAKRVPIVSK